ncbi:hypothetical protein C1646_676341 [Rhizophagus diaphanus]|nr:hypothetical protein C1646_676341 [Rhizophagus diaphanus] [Rhizophagus sp. MUCL 43196]
MSTTKRKYKPKNYRLIEYIKVLGKQNLWNTYAVCLACSENLEENELKNHTFTNKKPQVKNHLKNCVYFREKVGEQEEVDAIINLTDNENEEIARQKRLRTDVDSGEILIWKASDISSERECMIEIIPKIEDLIKGADELSTKVIAITSDSAATYSGAQRRLRLEYPNIVFLPCFAHQCQLAICDIFKESLTLKTASAKAITAAAYFKNGNNSYFIGKLRDMQKELYNKYYSIMVSGETRWNSHYFCFKSLVRSKQALQNLAIQHEHPQLTPENDKVLSINKLHASINFSFRKKELQKNQAEFLDLNAKPVETEFSNLQILDGDSAEVLQQNPVDNNNNDDDGNVESENDILTSERWERELAEWDEMLIEEEVSRLGEEEALRDNPSSLRGDLLTEYTHPAIDTRAKWQLKTLFSPIINIPAYLKSNEMV